MTQPERSDTPPKRLDLRVGITPEFEARDDRKMPYINGVIVLLAAAVPDESVADTIALAIERWRALR